MMTLRLRYLPTAATPNATDEIPLSDGYAFANAVRLVDTALAVNKQFTLQTSDGEMVLVNPRDLQTIGIREVL